MKRLLLLLQFAYTWAFNCTNTAVLVLADDFSQERIETELLAATAASGRNMQYWFLKLNTRGHPFFELTHIQTCVVHGSQTVTIDMVAQWNEEKLCYFLPCLIKGGNNTMCQPTDGAVEDENAEKRELLDLFISQKLFVVLVRQMSHQTCQMILGPEGPRPVKLQLDVTPNYYHKRILDPACRRKEDDWRLMCTNPIFFVPLGEEEGADAIADLEKDLVELNNQNFRAKYWGVLKFYNGSVEIFDGRFVIGISGVGVESHCHPERLGQFCLQQETLCTIWRDDKLTNKRLNLSENKAWSLLENLKRGALMVYLVNVTNFAHCEPVTDTEWTVISAEKRNLKEFHENLIQECSALVLGGESLNLNKTSKTPKTILPDERLPETVALIGVYTVVTLMLVVFCVVWSRLNPDPNGYAEMGLNERAELR